MAPTEGRVARPERRLDCRRGTPANPMADANKAHIVESSRV